MSPVSNRLGESGINIVVELITRVQVALHRLKIVDVPDHVSAADKIAVTVECSGIHRRDAETPADRKIRRSRGDTGIRKSPASLGVSPRDRDRRALIHDSVRQCEIPADIHGICLDCPRADCPAVIEDHMIETRRTGMDRVASICGIERHGSRARSEYPAAIRPVPAHVDHGRSDQCPAVKIHVATERERIPQSRGAAIEIKTDQTGSRTCRRVIGAIEDIDRGTRPGSSPHRPVRPGSPGRAGVPGPNVVLGSSDIILPREMRQGACERIPDWRKDVPLICSADVINRVAGRIEGRLRQGNARTGLFSDTGRIGMITSDGPCDRRAGIVNIPVVRKRAAVVLPDQTTGRI